MRHLLLVLCLLAFRLGLLAIEDTTRYTVISLKQALKENKVKTLITGSDEERRYYRLTDADGLHYGRCMDVVIESQLDTFVVLKLDAGYSLIPEDSSYQMMFVTKTIEFPSYPGRTVPFNIYAMCGEIHKPPPNSSVMYHLGEMADSSLLATIKIIEREYLQNMIGQHMIWAVANQAKREELIKYGADSASLMKTTSLLAENKIDCSLVHEIQPSSKAVNERPAFMKVSKWVFYAGITYMIAITAGAIVLFVYSHRKRMKISV